MLDKDIPDQKTKTKRVASCAFVCVFRYILCEFCGFHKEKKMKMVRGAELKLVLMKEENIIWSAKIRRKLYEIINNFEKSRSETKIGNKERTWIIKLSVNLKTAINNKKTTIKKKDK